MESIEDRIEREQLFHNDRFGKDIDPRAGLDRWYRAVKVGQELQDLTVSEMARGKIVLEYGCSDGGLSLDALSLPSIARAFVGIDISDVAIEKAKIKSSKHAFNNTQFLSMNAEAMNFNDAEFDIVYGRGILHHLDLARAYSEISRVLKPSGVAVFYEPMGHNPIINWYRNRTPEMRTADEHPLLAEDFLLAKNFFRKVNLIFFGLFTLIPIFLKIEHKGIFNTFLRLDNLVLRIPGVRYLAWYCLIEMEK
jgi:ubiquinone/menaquinone biosynthesis C-methylase UbiE